MINRRGMVTCSGTDAGILEETSDGYRYTYLESYVASGGHAVSLTLPVRREPYESKTLFAFFYGLLAEGNLKDLQCQVAKLDPEDHFGRLLATASTDVIGNVRIRRMEA